MTQHSADAENPGPVDLAVVSHSCVRVTNQSVYEEIARNRTVALLVPDRWRDEYAPDGFKPVFAPGLAQTARSLRIALPGRPQRHFYVANPIATLKHLAPSHLLIEQEPYSLSALEWGVSAARLGVPFSLRVAENMERTLPPPVKAWTRYLLKRAQWVMGCGEGTRELMARWGAGSRSVVVPLSVPAWSEPNAPLEGHAIFTVGYAGRLTKPKGVYDLVQAMEMMQHPARVIFIGDGAERTPLAATPGVTVQPERQDEKIREAYRQLDVLVVPSRTTPTWKEQFGRVIVEALWSGVPVVGSDSGEIPNLIETTGGGRIFPEGDVARLADILDELARDPAQRATLAQAGQRAAMERYSPRAVAQTIETLLFPTQG